MGNNQCSNVKQLQTTALRENRLSESEMIFGLAILQFNCFRDFAENLNDFPSNQQILLHRKIMHLLEELENQNSLKMTNIAL